MEAVRLMEESSLINTSVDKTGRIVITTIMENIITTVIVAMTPL